MNRQARAFYRLAEWRAHERGDRVSPIDPVVVTFWLAMFIVGVAFVFATGWTLGWLGATVGRVLSGEFAWPL